MQSDSLPDFVLGQLMRTVAEVLGMPADKVGSKEIQTVLRALGNEREHRLTPFLLECVREYMRGVVNANHDMEVNGERILLEALAEAGLSNVMDVGANVGDWSSMCRQTCGDATIHAFEIVPETFTSLETALASDPKVVLNSLGLSDQEGPISVYTYKGNSEVASSVEYPHEGARTTIEARCTTGDLYMTQNDIEHIDFLKVDVEGAESRVLGGFASAFERDAISIVQFEYGKANIVSRFLLNDYYQFFESRDFSLGKLYPNRVAFKDYTFIDEDFMGYNYVACSNKRPDLIEKLRAF